MRGMAETRAPGEASQLDLGLVPAATGAVAQVSPDKVASASLDKFFQRFTYLAPVLSLLIGWWSLASHEVKEPGGLGLITVLPAGAWVALGILLVSVAVTVGRNEFTGFRAALHAVSLILLLHGAPALLYSQPRFPTAWVHAGFIDYIERTGSLLPTLDARFSWPGFFAAAAMLSKLAGIKNPVSLIAWFPALANLAYVLVILTISRVVISKPQTRWLAVWVFLLASWVGQDYLSPQATNLFLYLSVIAILLTYFRPRPRSLEERAAAESRGGLRGWFSSWVQTDIDIVPTTPAQRVGLLVVLLIMAFASDVSHQLTPFMMIGAAATLAAFRRTTLRGLPILLLCGAFIYISYAAVPFWSGHLHSMFGSFGKVGSSVGANVGDRVRGDSAHMKVVQIRLLMTAVVGAMGILGLARLKRARVEPAIILLAGFPCSVLVLQSYGGEALLRAYAFALPFIVLCLVLGFTAGKRTLKPVLRGVGIGALSLVAALGFFVARFGNEKFEFTRTTEVQAMDWVYDHASEGSTIAAYDRVLPWAYKDIEAFKHIRYRDELGRGTPADIAMVADALRKTPDGYVVLTTSQEAAGQQNHGLGDQWLTGLRNRMVSSGQFTLVFENSDAWVLQITPAAQPAS
jgi:hypothetical protein